jgi:glycosyltransferase involved in cell wall biosynthesis
MNPASSRDLTSIIVPCCNQREFTEHCLRALFQHTRPAWELIVVDNGSTDGTALYVAGVRDAAPVPVTVIRNERNFGFPRAINQGLQVASGEHLVLLNNDAVVTDGWLDQLIALISMNVPTTRDTPPPQKPPNPGGPGDPRAGEEAHARPIGLVGPMSNYAPPPQLVEDVPYHDLDQMHLFARRWRDDHRGQWFTAAKLSGFCVLMRRGVYESIGGLDERCGLGYFDDDDLAVRARQAGFELAVARDLFLHHFGSRTFAGNGIDAERLLQENAQRFAAKWGHDGSVGRRVVLSPWGASQRSTNEGGEECRPQMDADGRRWGERNAEFINQDSRFPISGKPPDTGSFPACRFPGALNSIDSSSHLRPSAPICGQDSSGTVGSPGPRPKVSLTMIVRDEEENLPHCLESVRGIFDEIVVVDTGSTDRTGEVAREYGANVFEFAWIDDFAAARNAALEHATGDYAFWLDADDVIEPPERTKVLALLEGLRLGDQAGYVVRCACDPGEDGSGGETVVDHIRLFPLRPDVRWSYRVHEQILPALRRAGIPVRWTDLVVRHTGYADVALRARKLERDTRILLEELKDRPDEPFGLFNLGAIATERRDWSGALGYLRKSLELSAPSDSITRKLFALIARSHQMLGDTAGALRTCGEGLSLDAEDAELWFRKAVVHRHRGESAEAEACWRRILGLKRPDRFASVDMGIYGHLTRRNLAVLAAERGDAAEAARLWSEVLAECPGDREARAMLDRREKAAIASPHS